MHELNGFEVPQCQLDKVEPILPNKLDSSCPVYVDSEAALANMVKNLKNERELAVDLEVSFQFILLYLYFFVFFSYVFSICSIIITVPSKDLPVCYKFRREK